MNEVARPQGEHQSSDHKDESAPVGYIDLLRRNRSFRRLWLGQVVSQLGDWFNTIALYTLALKLSGSGKAVGLILVARFLPSVICGPLAGVIADRFDRRRIMIVADLLRALVVLGFLLVRRPDQMPLLYALTVLQLALATFFDPAETAILPSLVAKRELIAANAITSVTWSAMLTLGATVGGFVTGWFGTDAAFVIDSLTYLVSAALIATVRLPPISIEAAERVSLDVRKPEKLTIGRALGITDTMEGVAYVFAHRGVFALILVKAAWGLGGGILTLLAIFGEKIFPVGGRAATGIGVLYAARGIGTAIGPVAARRFAGERPGRMHTAIGIAFFIGGFFYILFGQATNFGFALFFLLVAHIGGSILWVFSTVLLQSTVEENFRGRVFAAELTLFTLAMAASNYLTGELLDRFNLSPRIIAIGIGIFFLLPGLLWFATRKWWNEERRKPPDELNHADAQMAATDPPARPITVSTD